MKIFIFCHPKMEICESSFAGVEKIWFLSAPRLPADSAHSLIPPGKGGRGYTEAVAANDGLVDEGRTQDADILPAAGRGYGALRQDDDLAGFF
jgi:hypothetical protein